MQIKRIHHLTVAVRDVERARATFEALFESTSDATRDVPAFGVRTRDVPMGDDVLQVASPLQPAGPVMRFIERKGEGFYNLALEVDDLDAAIAELASRGIKVSEPIEATPGVRSSFVSMGATHGLSLQLVETFEPHDEPSPITDESTDEFVSPPEPNGADTVESPSDPASPLDLTPDEWSDVD